MSLKDFEKIDKGVEKVDDESLSKSDVLIKDIEFKDIEYYLSHLDELIKCVEESYNVYDNAKLVHDFKKDKLQLTVNWNEENALRVGNNLPKITNQDQRNSAINLKVKSLSVNMETCKIKYNFYKKLFEFISNNYGLLCKSYNVGEILEK